MGIAMEESSRTPAPESLRVDDIYQSDAKTIQDMGYNVVKQDDGTVVVEPGRAMDRVEELRFIGETMESLGYEKVRAGPAEAVFEEADR